MNIYKYKYLSNKQFYKGYINAQSKVEAIKVLQSTYDRVISVQRSWIVRTINSKKIIEWFRVLSGLMKEGIKIENALEIMSTHEEHKFSLIILDLIKSGQSFQSSLKFCSFFFDNQSIKLIDSLSKTLSIEGSCDFLVAYKSKLNEKYNKIRNALLQPLLTLIIVLVMFFGIIFFLKGSLESLFQEMNIPMPKFIEILNGLDSTKILCIAFVLLAFLYGLFVNFFKLPFIKECMIDKDLFIACYFIGNSINHGLSIIESIDNTMHPIKTKSIKILLQKMRTDILQGSSVFRSIQNSSLDKMYINIIRINELSGRIAQGFISVSEVADKAFMKRLNTVEKLINPVLTIFTGVIIVCFLNCFIFPIYTCMTTIF